MARGRTYNTKICRLCGKQIETWEELVKIKPRGKYGRMNTYHENCIEQERQNNRRNP